MRRKRPSATAIPGTVDWALLGMLAGCGGNSGSSDTSGTASRGRPLSLQLRLSSELSAQTVRAAQHEGLTSTQARQAQPGDPGFIERFEVRLQAQGEGSRPPAGLQARRHGTGNGDAGCRWCQTPPRRRFRCWYPSLLARESRYSAATPPSRSAQTSAVVTLTRSALVPVPATPANLQQTTFFFTDGAIFGLANIPVTLAMGTFVGHVGDFALTAMGRWRVGT